MIFLKTIFQECRPTTIVSVGSELIKTHSLRKEIEISGRYGVTGKFLPGQIPVIFLLNKRHLNFDPQQEILQYMNFLAKFL